MATKTTRTKKTQREDEGHESVSVEIFGRTYHLRGSEDPDYLEELARFVDDRMRDAADDSATADTLKVAILACLNVTDEYLQLCRGRGLKPDRTGERRVAKMVSRLEAALAD